MALTILPNLHHALRLYRLSGPGHNYTVAETASAMDIDFLKRVKCIYLGKTTGSRNVQYVK
nr:Uncharacterised protein [Enterobacter ludwigii]CAH8250356.1 Uncharacterised protein [Escherichia coli]